MSQHQQMIKLVVDTLQQMLEPQEAVVRYVPLSVLLSPPSTMRSVLDQAGWAASPSEHYCVRVVVPQSAALVDQRRVEYDKLIDELQRAFARLVIEPFVDFKRSGAVATIWFDDSNYQLKLTCWPRTVTPFEVELLDCDDQVVATGYGNTWALAVKQVVDNVTDDIRHLTTARDRTSEAADLLASLSI